MKSRTKQIRLRFLFDTFSGATPKSNISEYWDGEIPWITPKDLGRLEGKELENTQRKLTVKGYESCGTRLADVRSLVLSKRAPIGQAAILAIKASCNQGCFLLSSTKEIDERFYYYCLIHLRICLEMLGRGSTFMELSSDDLRSVRLPFLPLSNQTKIADYLDKEIEGIDTLVTEKEHMLSILEEKRMVLISHSVTHGLNSNVFLIPSGLSWLGDIPAHWDIVRGKFLFSQSNLPVNEKDGIVTCFRDGQVTLRKNRRLTGFTNAIKELGYQGIRAGQLVLHSMDAFAGAIGISDSDGKCSPEYIICDPISEEVVSEYYGQLLRVMALRGYIQAACTAVRERAPRIRFSHIANMFLPVPPPGEQKQIVNNITHEHDQTAELESELKKSIVLLKERRSALITAAVTGQLEPEEMNL